MENLKKRNLEVINSIVSKISKIIQYRNNLGISKITNNHLMIIGGTVTERDACIDYVTATPFGKMVGLPKLDLAKTAEQTIIDCKNKPFYIENLMERIAELNNINKSKTNETLILIKDITEAPSFVLTSLLNFFENFLNQNTFIIVTAESLKKLDFFPPNWEKWIDIFEKIDITTNDGKSKRYYPSKTKVDNILIDHMRKYPNKPREFIVKHAIPILINKFPESKPYGKNTLISRISNIRKREYETLY